MVHFYIHITFQIAIQYNFIVIRYPSVHVGSMRKNFNGLCVVQDKFAYGTQYR